MQYTGTIPKQKMGVKSYSNYLTSSSSKFVSQKPEIISDFCRELLQLQDQEITPNPEAFDCPICFATIDALKGVILKNCLHTFCKECLNATVKYNEKAEVVCPYKDDVYSCECILQDQEIRGISSKEVREEHIWRSLELAEMTSEGAFHCQTPYCFGWWIVAGEMENELVHNCPVCKVQHCVSCSTIHNGMSCAQYKDKKIDDDDPLSKVVIDSMADRPDSLRCPGCRILIERIEGCDYLECHMCKTGICFVTGLPRRGPNGCHCNENGKKCHPNCNNCH